MSTEDNNLDFDNSDDGSNGADSNSDSYSDDSFDEEYDFEGYEVLDDDYTVWGSESEPEPEPDLVNAYVTYSTECQPMIRLIEKHQRRTDSLEELPWYLKPILANDFERGAQVILQEITRRLSVFQYESVYKFSEGLRDPGTQVRKLDLFNIHDILLGDTEGERTLPSYFKPFFMIPFSVIPCTDLLRFSDFMVSVKLYHMPMTTYVKQDMKRHYKHFKTLSAIRNFRCEEFQKCLDELDSLIVQFKKCEGDLHKDFEFFDRAMQTLRSIVIKIRNVPDTPISLGVTSKLCRLSDFCSYSVVLYANTVLDAMEVIKSYSNTKKKLQSFQIL